MPRLSGTMKGEGTVARVISTSIMEGPLDAMQVREHIKRRTRPPATTHSVLPSWALILLPPFALQQPINIA